MTRAPVVDRPMATGIDVGSEPNAPLARAVIGGLAVSTVLTLVLIPTLLRDARGAVPPPHRESRGGARRTRRRGMTVIAPLRLLAVIALLLAALADPGAAQPTAADPMAPRDPLPAPARAASSSRLPEVAGRELGIEQAVAIALANQPTIQNRASALHRRAAARGAGPVTASAPAQRPVERLPAEELRADHRAGGTDGDRQRVDADHRHRHRLPASLRLREELGGHRRGQGQ